jgi:hypothetical protein
MGLSHWRLTGFGEGPGNLEHRQSARANFAVALNLVRARAYLILRGWRGGSPPSWSWSDQNEVEQREEGRSDGGGDQGEVGEDIRFGVERWLVDFLRHAGDLGQASRPFCEAGHIRPIFFKARLSGTSCRLRD